MSPSPSADQSAFTPTQARFVYWFNGIMPVITNIFTPLVTYWTCRRSVGSLGSKYNQIITEVSRQFISGTLGVASYFGGGEAAKGIMQHVMPEDDSKMGGSANETRQRIGMIVGAGVMGFLSYSFVRPFLATKLVSDYLVQKSDADMAALKRELAQSQGLQKTMAQLKFKVNNGLQDLFAKNTESPNIARAAKLSTGILAGYLGVLLGVAWLWDRRASRKSFPQQGQDTRLPVRKRAEGRESVISYSGSFENRWPVIPSARSFQPSPRTDLYFSNQQRLLTSRPTTLYNPWR